MNWAQSSPGQLGFSSSFNYCSPSSSLPETSGLWLLVPVPETALPIPIRCFGGRRSPTTRKLLISVRQRMKKPLGILHTPLWSPCDPLVLQGAACQPQDLVPVPGCCWEQRDDGSLAGYLPVTTSECVGEKMDVPEDRHTAVPSPSKGEPGGRAGQGAVAHGHS